MTPSDTPRPDEDPQNSPGGAAPEIDKAKHDPDPADSETPEPATDEDPASQAADGQPT